MSFVSAVSNSTTDMFIIPCTGKMFFSSVDKGNKALCICLNKGYVQTDALEDMLNILDLFQGDNTYKLVGNIEKVRLQASGNLVYRQRVFFKSIVDLLGVCKKGALAVRLDTNFGVSINSVMNVLDQLVYLERYAKEFDESIDDWLHNVCKVHLHIIMSQKGLASGLDAEVDEILTGRSNYLSRAPFLLSSYDIDTHSSSVYLPKDLKYYPEGSDINKLNFGFTTQNVKRDVREGRL